MIARQNAAHNRSKLRLLHLYTIAAFLLGGVLGVVAYQAIAGWLFMVAAGLLFAIALTGISRRGGSRSACDHPVSRQKPGDRDNKKGRVENAARVRLVLGGCPSGGKTREIRVRLFGNGEPGE